MKGLEDAPFQVRTDARATDGDNANPLVVAVTQPFAERLPAAEALGMLAEIGDERPYLEGEGSLNAPLTIIAAVSPAY